MRGKKKTKMKNTILVMEREQVVQKNLNLNARAVKAKLLKSTTISQASENMMFFWLALNARRNMFSIYPKVYVVGS